ncbi:MAG TPA: Rad52/Rad22 family DNA repair protein [Gemmatimonadaceae bacterium]|nr:Rad52/Rad22 family DNA repair protein [Gemmatimonadaceae bacterium]
MIARHETSSEKTDIWTQLSAPLPADVISWRQDGRPIQRDGKYFARFVAYIEANTVRERLDGVVPGEWDLTLELLPALSGEDRDDAACSFKARLQILGVIREDVGTGRDYKQAATDAFKRAAVRFGIAHELYGYEQNWVQVDGDGKYARPLEDPADAYARRQHRQHRTAEPRPDDALHESPEPAAAAATGPLASDEPSCPKCGGRMWDNRISKRNPKAPDFKCRSRSCDGVIWPPKAGAGDRGLAAGAAEPAGQADLSI